MVPFSSRGVQIKPLPTAKKRALVNEGPPAFRLRCRTDYFFG